MFVLFLFLQCTVIRNSLSNLGTNMRRWNEIILFFHLQIALFLFFALVHPVSFVFTTRMWWDICYRDFKGAVLTLPAAYSFSRIYNFSLLCAWVLKNISLLLIPFCCSSFLHYVLCVLCYCAIMGFQFIGQYISFFILLLFYFLILVYFANPFFSPFHLLSTVLFFQGGKYLYLWLIELWIWMTRHFMRFDSFTWWFKRDSMCCDI